MKQVKVLSVLLSVILMSGFSVAKAMDSTQVGYTPTKPAMTTVLASGYTNHFYVNGGSYTFPTNVKSKCNASISHPILQLAVNGGDTGPGTVDSIYVNGSLNTSTYNITFYNTRVYRYRYAPANYFDSPIVVSWTIYCVPN
jgi:hypothetical protein